MAGNPRSVYIGGCWIVWGGSVIGLTVGGIELTVQTKTKPSSADQSGTSTINEFVIGRNLIFKMKLAETTLDNFYAILSNAGATQPNGPNTGVWVQTISGWSLVPDAAPMLLRPVNAPDGSQDIYLPGVAYTGKLEFSYKADQVRTFDLEFIGFGDYAYRLMFYGSSPQAQAMGALLTSGQNFNIIDPVIGDTHFHFIEDRQGHEIAFR